MSATPAAPVIVDVLGHAEPTIVDAQLPFIYADDLAAVRGDGIFETLMLRDGEVKKLDLHFSRFCSGAQMLDLPQPDRARWMRASQLAAEEFVAQNPAQSPDEQQEAALRWVYSRGRESTGEHTGWITVMPASPALEVARTHGVRVMTAQRGFSLDLSQPSPWALVGAKTLSYAANMAALRHAKKEGFDDVIFLSDERLVLEGPTSSVIALRDKTLVTPPVKSGILPGTTQSALFAVAQQHGWATAYQPLTVDELVQSDGVWLVSSVRVQARVTAIDGQEMPRPEAADEIENLMRLAVN